VLQLARPLFSSEKGGAGPTARLAAPRAELLHFLMLPDFDRADRIGSYWGNPKTRAFAELLIACEEDRTLRAVLVDMLRGATRFSGVGRTVSRQRMASRPSDFVAVLPTASRSALPGVV
jgi:hypothetical protein